MASANKVILIGNLGADPEMPATAAGESICNPSDPRSMRMFNAPSAASPSPAAMSRQLKRRHVLGLIKTVAHTNVAPAMAASR